MTTKDLIKLNFHKNADGEYHCPLTFKVFTENSHIVAVRTSGNVFSFESVDQLNVKPKNWTDLVSGEAFTRADLITLQNPNDWSKRQIDLFAHVRAKRDAVSRGEVVEEAAKSNGTHASSNPVASFFRRYCFARPLGACDMSGGCWVTLCLRRVSAHVFDRVIERVM